MVRREVREMGGARVGGARRGVRSGIRLPTAPLPPFFLGLGDAAGVLCEFRRAG
jgi:hypothetical protein